MLPGKRNAGKNVCREKCSAGKNVMPGKIMPEGVDQRKIGLGKMYAGKNDMPGIMFCREKLCPRGQDAFFPGRTFLPAGYHVSLTLKVPGSKPGSANFYLFLIKSSKLYSCWLDWQSVGRDGPVSNEGLLASKFWILIHFLTQKGSFFWSFWVTLCTYMANCQKWAKYDVKSSKFYSRWLDWQSVGRDAPVSKGRMLHPNFGS